MIPQNAKAVNPPKRIANRSKDPIVGEKETYWIMTQLVENDGALDGCTIAKNIGYGAIAGLVYGFNYILIYSITTSLIPGSYNPIKFKSR